MCQRTNNFEELGMKVQRAQRQLEQIRGVGKERNRRGWLES
ncbi:hypothetical protein [Nocardia sp. NPDC051570]